MTDQRFDIVVSAEALFGLATALHATRNFSRLRLLLVEKEDIFANTKAATTAV